MSKPGQPSFKFNRAARRSIYETGQKKGIASPARQPTVACRRRNHVLDLQPLHKFRPINSAGVAEMDCGLAQRLQAVPVVSNLFPKQTLLQRSTMPMSVELEIDAGCRKLCPLGRIHQLEYPAR